MPVVTQTTERSGRAAGGERVGHRGVGDADPRLGHVGQRAQPVDHAVQLGRLLGADLAGPHRAHGDLVGGPPLVERRRRCRRGRCSERVAAAGTMYISDDDERHEQRAEQEHDRRHPDGEPGVLDEACDAGPGAPQPGIRPSSLSSSRTSSMRGVGRRAGSGRTRRGCRRRAASPTVRTPSSSAARARGEGRRRRRPRRRASSARVELVEPVQRVVGDVVLPLAEDPDDHGWASLARRLGGSAAGLLGGLGLEDVATVLGRPRSPAAARSPLSRASSASTSACGAHRRRARG